MKSRNFVAKNLRLRSEPHEVKCGKNVKRAIAKAKFRKMVKQHDEE